MSNPSDRPSNKLPKMRLPYAPTPLRLVANAGPAEGDKPLRDDAAEPLYRGVGYPPEQWRNWAISGHTCTDIMVGGLSLTTHSGEIVRARDDCTAFVWNHLGDLALSENECQLLSASLENLSIEEVIGGSLLAITPSFTLSYKTLAHAAQLGEIRLVAAHRFVTDVEGGQRSLLDTDAADGPVLYLESPEDTAVLRQITPWQSRNSQRDYCFDYRISQPLLPEWHGVPVSSVTVLEQYSSFFMQRAVSCNPDQAIWVPAYAPITWGWSLRVERENGDWVITRRKLVPPVVGHDGWQLPQWRGNTLDYTRHPDRATNNFARD